MLIYLFLIYQLLLPRVDILSYLKSMLITALLLLCLSSDFV